MICVYRYFFPRIGVKTCTAEMCCRNTPHIPKPQQQLLILATSWCTDVLCAVFSLRNVWSWGNAAAAGLTWANWHAWGMLVSRDLISWGAHALLDLTCWGTLVLRNITCWGVRVSWNLSCWGVRVSCNLSCRWMFISLDLSCWGARVSRYLACSRACV